MMPIRDALFGGFRHGSLRTFCRSRRDLAIRAARHPGHRSPQSNAPAAPALLSIEVQPSCSDREKDSVRRKASPRECIPSSRLAGSSPASRQSGQRTSWIVINPTSGRPPARPSVQSGLRQGHLTVPRSHYFGMPFPPITLV